MNNDDKVKCILCLVDRVSKTIKDDNGIPLSLMAEFVQFIDVDNIIYRLHFITYKLHFITYRTRSTIIVITRDQMYEMNNDIEAFVNKYFADPFHIMKRACSKEDA
jgi:hypothetical protein